MVARRGMPPMSRKVAGPVSSDATGAGLLWPRTCDSTPALDPPPEFAEGLELGGLTGHPGDVPEPPFAEECQLLGRDRPQMLDDLRGQP